MNGWMSEDRGYTTRRDVMFKVGDTVKVIVDNPWRAPLMRGDVVQVHDVYSVSSMQVSGGWALSAIEGHHAELTDEAMPDQAHVGKFAISKDKAASLCRLYAQYLQHHAHDDAFRIAWGIEVDGLPF